MTAGANTVFALTLFAAITALAMWLARRHQRTMYRRHMARNVVNTLASPSPETAETQADGEAEDPVNARIA